MSELGLEPFDFAGPLGGSALTLDRLLFRLHVTVVTPADGPGCREHSYDGFGGGHSHFPRMLLAL
jgi:hypothetical protein